MLAPSPLIISLTSCLCSTTMYYGIVLFGIEQDQRLFLVRNARAGADLLTRKRMLMCRVVRPASTPIASTPASAAPRPNGVATDIPDSSSPKKTDGSAGKVGHGASGHQGTVGSGATVEAPSEAVPRGAAGGDTGRDIVGAPDRALGGDTERALGGDTNGDLGRACGGDTDGDSARAYDGDTDGATGGDLANAQRKPTDASARSAETSAGSAGRKRAAVAYPESSDCESSNASDAIAGKPTVVARSTENGVESTKKRARSRASECESRSTERSSRRAVRGNEHAGNRGGAAESTAVCEGQEIEQTDEQGARGNKRVREGTEEEVDQNSRRSSATRRRSGLQLKR